ncbi:DUF4890 domain-containing protein [uncultured Bacteroides sp.]|uniref:DUF4890 domain-containing protein n=1 Tax=uncultured Bacteroides sp. TaxID=162156 RepID=UPI002AA87593|nr:DUF4890 domain-containing protein [uncultured Bacteroides sp.]
MKKIAFLMVALLMVGGMAMAQGRGHGKNMDPKERAQKMTERIAKEYSLNDTQKQQLLEANTALVEKMSNRSDENKDKRAEMRKEMQANRDAYEAQLKKIMTEEQYASYTKDQAERQKKMSEGRRGPRGGASDAQ